MVGDFDNAAYAFHIMQRQNLAAIKSSHVIQADLECLVYRPIKISVNPTSFAQACSIENCLLKTWLFTQEDLVMPP